MSANLREHGYSPHEAKLGLIDNPGEQVRLSAPFQGRVRCGELIVDYGVSCDIDVDADRVVVGGVLKGLVRARELFVTTEGSYVGEVDAQIVKVKGKIRGLVNAREIQAVAGAVLQGQILSDSVGARPGVDMAAQVWCGPGIYGREDLLERARAILAETDIPVAAGPLAPVSGPKFELARDPEPELPVPAEERAPARMPEPPRPAAASGARPFLI